MRLMRSVAGLCLASGVGSFVLPACSPEVSGPKTESTGIVQHTEGDRLHVGIAGRYGLAAAAGVLQALAFRHSAGPFWLGYASFRSTWRSMGSAFAAQRCSAGYRASRPR
jgi:hypothetical protein